MGSSPMRLLVAILLAILTLGCAAAGGQTFTVTNPLNISRPDAVMIAPASLLGEGAIQPGAYAARTDSGQGCLVQADDLDGDGRADEIVALPDLGPGERTRLHVVYRADSGPYRGPWYADARASWRFAEGGYAALETDRIAYGLYGIFAPLGVPGTLAWDCYGKRPEAWRLSLDELAGINYHQDNPVAVDFLILGKTLGLGGPFIGQGRPVHGQDGCHFQYRVLARGPVRAGLEVRVSEWRTPAGGSYNATIRYWVYAHHDFIDAEFTIEPVAAADEHFGVGVRKIPGCTQFLASRGLGILALWGRQANIIGETGLGLIFDPADFVKWHTWNDSSQGYGVYLGRNLKDGQNVKILARLVGVWSEGGVATADSFIPHLKDLALRFGTPVVLSNQ